MEHEPTGTKGREQGVGEGRAGTGACLYGITVA
jgi:hypothetical protein